MKAYKDKLRKSEKEFREDLGKAGQQITEDVQKKIYMRFYSDFFKDKKQNKLFDKELKDYLILTYGSGFDEIKKKIKNSTMNGPLEIDSDRKKAFINQSDGANNFHSKKVSIGEWESLLNLKLNKYDL